jgi:uncharacterized membrane protein YphA (DoxX/SURF4 family)
VFHLLNSGLDLTDIALFINRVILGGFFILARFRFFYDPSKPGREGVWGYDLHWRFITTTPSQRWFNADRRKSLHNKLSYCGFKHPAWVWVVAITEVGAGILLISGLFTALAGLCLLVLTLRASVCTARTKVFEQNPCDPLDVCACYLWRVEGLYIVMSAVCVLAGPGSFALSEVL